MSKISLGYVGFSKKALSTDQLLKLFDGLWGEASRKLPSFPEVVGGVHASWHSADGKLHTVGHIDELVEAYKKELTYDVRINGKINNNPRCSFVYIPAFKQITFGITADTEEIANQYLSQVKDMFPDAENPTVFISYAREELALADFVKKVLSRLFNNKVEVFVATRDIRPGDNPLKVMMEDKLKTAQAIIPICSLLSKNSSWVWWESSAVWARGCKVYPLCTNITLGDFGAPLSLVAQGRHYFTQTEFAEMFQEVCQQFEVDAANYDLTKEELSEYRKLEEEYTKKEASAKINVTYTNDEINQAFHRYSFIFEVENKTNKVFEDVTVMLYFPYDYLEKKDWGDPFLKALREKDMPGYLCLTFIFSNLPELAKKQFKTGLLPGQKLRVFGLGGIANLLYQMDNARWEERFRFQVQWKVYVNGGAPQEGSIPLDNIQCF